MLVVFQLFIYINQNLSKKFLNNLKGNLNLSSKMKEVWSPGS